MNKYLICMATTFLLITSCGTSPKKARQELTKIGVAYNDEEFYKALKEQDQIAIDLFIHAERDASFLLANAIDFYTKQEHENIELAKKFINNSLNVNVIRSDDSGSRSALAAAVSNNNIEITELLLSKGANPNINNGEALRIALLITGNLKTADLLIDHGADINYKNKEMSLLSEIILINSIFEQNGKPNLVKYLIDQGAEINDGKEGMSQSLANALILRNTELVEILLKKGAKIKFIERNPHYPVVMSWEEKFERDFFNQIAQDSPEIITLLDLLHE